MILRTTFELLVVRSAGKIRSAAGKIFQVARRDTQDFFLFLNAPNRDDNAMQALLLRGSLSRERIPLA